MLGYVYGHTAGTRLTRNALVLVWLRPVDKLFAGPGLTRKLSSNQDFGIKVAAPIGNLFGQLLFGFLADIVGRWLERDNRLFIPVVSSLLKSTRNAAIPPT